MNIELNFPPKLGGARSRLYRRRFLQVNTRWKALAEIYTMHSFAPFWNPHRSLISYVSKLLFQSVAPKKKLAIFDEKIEIRERSKTVQRSALCRSRRELSNEYLLAKIGVGTAENESLQFARR